MNVQAEDETGPSASFNSAYDAMYRRATTASSAVSRARLSPGGPAA
ncbi:hypothetical protein [Streptomyces sp. E1N211]|nr:hypothetical protein [Streptomyces sp. E1N211]